MAACGTVEEEFTPQTEVGPPVPQCVLHESRLGMCGGGGAFAGPGVGPGQLCIGLRGARIMCRCCRSGWWRPAVLGPLGRAAHNHQRAWLGAFRQAGAGGGASGEAGVE